MRKFHPPAKFRWRQSFLLHLDFQLIFKTSPPHEIPSIALSALQLAEHLESKITRSFQTSSPAVWYSYKLTWPWGWRTFRAAYEHRSLQLNGTTRRSTRLWMNEYSMVSSALTQWMYTEEITGPTDRSFLAAREPFAALIMWVMPNHWIAFQFGLPRS